ncbi:hypothetical protein R4J03_05490 [Brachyspira intermedia]|uniref:hypothetical protein n=1 Tax=Brachyspira intermedia TaxID=84377 RepID=UPI00261525B5|nr:hypothetical protein [uncultured Brachyspira sp.]
MENSNKSNRYDLTDDYEREKLFQDLMEDIKNFTLFGILDDESFEINRINGEKKSLNDFMKSEIDSENDINMKKLFSTIMYIASKKGVLGDSFKEKTEDEIAHIVDGYLIAVKLAYKVGKGEIEADEYVAAVIDRNAAGLAFLVKEKIRIAIENTMEKAGEVAGVAVFKVAEKFYSSNIPVVSSILKSIVAISEPAVKKIGGMVGKLIGQFAGNIIAEAIDLGVKTINKYVKPLIKKAFEKGKEAVNWAKEKLEDGINWVKEKIFN